MKLATLKDGRLVVVSRDLTRAAPVGELTPSLLDALSRWTEVESVLRQTYDSLNRGSCQDVERFEPALAAPPIPRPPQWLDGSAFENHGRLMEKAFNMPPADYSTNPMMYQGNADDFIGACDDVVVPSEADGIDLEGELGILTDDVPMGCAREQALSHVRLFVLINDISLRTHAPREMKTGFGWIQAKPCTALSSVAVTPDELGEAWTDGHVSLDMIGQRNGQHLGRPNGREMSFGFDQLIAYAAYSRTLRSGTVIGSGTFSNRARGAGSVCIAERRAIELIDHGEITTPFLKFGERVRLEMIGLDGISIFGAIDQRIACPPIVN